MWKNPVPYYLVMTDKSESFKDMPDFYTGVPVAPHPGAFGVKRKHHTHEGVDLYVPEGTPVFAVESGVVIKVAPFTGPLANLPHWRDTQAVWVKGESGVVLYGEIEPLVVEGDHVSAGDWLGLVIPVLKEDKGRPMAMLHLELHTPDCNGSAPEWLDHDQRPAVLLDPTPYLAPLCAANTL